MLAGSRPSDAARNKDAVAHMRARAPSLPQALSGLPTILDSRTFAMATLALGTFKACGHRN